MTDMGNGVRAKRGYIKGKRYRKDGAVVPAQTHPVSGLAGAISGKEMESMMLKIADETGASADDVVVETYEKGEAPRESNPAIGDKFERYTRSVVTPAYQEGYDRIFGNTDLLDQAKKNRVVRGERD